MKRMFYRTGAMLCLTGACNTTPDVTPPEVTGPAVPTQAVTASGDARSSVEETLSKLIAACKDGALPEAARHIAYTGSDRERKFRTPLNASRPEELAEATKTCARSMPFAAGYTVVEYQTRGKTEGMWHALTLEADEGDAKNLFAFVQVGETYILGDID